MKTTVKNAEIIVDVETLEQTPAGSSILGKICWRFDDCFFPERHWYDFVLPLLCWWSSSLVELLSGSREKVTLLYMDGPQQMVVRISDADTLIFECHDRYGPEVQNAPTYVFIANRKAFLRRMILTMTRFVEWVYRQDFSFDDSLKSELELVKENSMRMKKFARPKDSPGKIDE